MSSVTKKQLDGIIAGGAVRDANGKRIDTNYLPKSDNGFSRLQAPSSTTLTDEQKAQVLKGCVVEGSFIGLENPVILPGCGGFGGSRTMGFVFGNRGDARAFLSLYAFDNNSNEIYKYQDIIEYIQGHGTLDIKSVEKFNGKSIPSYPSSTGSFTFQSVDGTLTWVAVSNGTAATKDVGTSAGNVPVLNSNGKLDSAVLPAITITDTFVVSTEASMLALTAQVGDVCIRTDLNKSFILKEDGASTLSNWQELLSPSNAVSSVAGKTGAVILAASDVGLGNCDNTSDLDKPISTATQTALDGKQSTLTFDDSPTSSSNNPVKSGGIYSYLSDRELTSYTTMTFNTWED